jgi:hypothetical protein
VPDDEAAETPAGDGTAAVTASGDVEWIERSSTRRRARLMSGIELEWRLNDADAPLGRTA